MSDMQHYININAVTPRSTITTIRPTVIHTPIGPSSATWANLVKQGWRKLIRAQVPDGERIVTWSWQETGDPDTVAEVVTTEAIPEPAIPESVLAKWGAFAAEYQNAVAAAIAAGADIPETVSYEVLVAALTQLPGDQWTRVAVALDALWNALCIVAEHELGLTRAQVYYELVPRLQALGGAA